MSERPAFTPDDNGGAAEPRPRRPMRHVFGVAFPYRHAGEAGGSELERSFLQLAYAVCRLRTGREEAVGYFAVLSQEMRDAVARLGARYQVGDAVHVVFASMLVSDMTSLAAAEERAEAEGDPSILVSVARQIACDALRREISQREPGACADATWDETPYGVAWDYYAGLGGAGGKL